LPEAEREEIDETRAIHLMLANLSLIKRPVLATGKKLQVGFTAEAYQAIFA